MRAQRLDHLGKLPGVHCRCTAREPLRQCGIGQCQKPFEGVQLVILHTGQPCLGITAENNVHLLGAAVGRSIGRATAPHLQIVGHGMNRFLG